MGDCVVSGGKPIASISWPMFEGSVRLDLGHQTPKPSSLSMEQFAVQHPSHAGNRRGGSESHAGAGGLG